MNYTIIQGYTTLKGTGEQEIRYNLSTNTEPVRSSGFSTYYTSYINEDPALTWEQWKSCYKNAKEKREKQSIEVELI